MAKLTAAHAAAAAALPSPRCAAVIKRRRTMKEREGRGGREGGRMRAKGRRGKPLKKVVRKKQRERERVRSAGMDGSHGTREGGERGGGNPAYTPDPAAGDGGHYVRPCA